MKRSLKQMLALTLIVTLLGAGLPSLAQRQTRASERQVEQALDRVDARTEAFRRSLDLALTRGRLNSTTRVSEINDHVRDFDAATETLRDRFNNRSDAAADVEALLRHAAAIDSFTRQNLRNTQAARDWDYLRTDLNTLARLYNVRADWNGSGYQSRFPNDNRYPNNSRYGNNNCLTGTYRLDPQRSDDAMRAAERATQSLDYNNRDRVRDNLMRRLEAPDTLSIDRRGRNVTLASTRAPQVTFEADGRARTEQNAQGRNISVSASLLRDQLTVTTTGDRGSDFTLTFEPIEGCRSLRVTRRLMNDRLNQPVIVQSTYERTADTAQLDLYHESTVGNRDFPANTDRTRGNFVVPDGTQIVAVLDTDLTTKEAREGERFTMTVSSPVSYDGAVIEGNVRSVERSGRVSGRAGVALDFDRIRLRNGQSHNFAGTIESVRTADGSDVRVDNESNVEEDDSQTSRTVTRAGIGAALGALIGAIAGGGKGAAIGAAVGAGAGAGTVIVQGRDDLDLKRGTEFSVRASAPR
jgi:hypothetical protein